MKFLEALKSILQQEKYKWLIEKPFWLLSKLADEIKDSNEYKKALRFYSIDKELKVFYTFHVLGDLGVKKLESQYDTISKQMSKAKFLEIINRCYDFIKPGWLESQGLKYESNSDNKVVVVKKDDGKKESPVVFDNGENKQNESAQPPQKIATPKTPKAQKPVAPKATPKPKQATPAKPKQPAPKTPKPVTPAKPKQQPKPQTPKPKATPQVPKAQPQQVKKGVFETFFDKIRHFFDRDKDQKQEEILNKAQKNNGATNKPSKKKAIDISLSGSGSINVIIDKGNGLRCAARNGKEYHPPMNSKNSLAEIEISKVKTLYVPVSICKSLEIDTNGSISVISKCDDSPIKEISILSSGSCYVKTSTPHLYINTSGSVSIEHTLKKNSDIDVDTSGSVSIALYNCSQVKPHVNTKGSKSFAFVGRNYGFVANVNVNTSGSVSISN